MANKVHELWMTVGIQRDAGFTSRAGSKLSLQSSDEVGVMNIATFLMLAGAWLIVAMTAEWFLRHRHKWRLRAVDHGVMSQPRRNATAILYVCASCGEARSTTLAGTYELEDILCPVSDRIETKQHEIAAIQWSAADQAFAKSMNVKL